MYCSSNTGNYLRINRERFADLTEEALGERRYPSDTPELSFTWPDVLDRLDAQLTRRGGSWGEGETLVVSMLTDAFSGAPLHDGTTEKALRMLFERSHFRIRVLTKNSVVGTSTRWLNWFRSMSPARVVVGLSTGSLDDEWARHVEVGCPPPSSRIRATRALQDAGVSTYGMLCPVFPDVLTDNRLETLVDMIRPERCETVWAEPYNDRDNWRRVRAGYADGSFGWRWFTETFERGDRRTWSRYATDLYTRLREKARSEGWLHKLKYLLYEGDISADDAAEFAGFEGVLLQDSPRSDGRSRNPAIAQLQGTRAPVAEAETPLQEVEVG